MYYHMVYEGLLLLMNCYEAYECILYSPKTWPILVCTVNTAQKFKILVIPNSCTADELILIVIFVFKDCSYVVPLPTFSVFIVIKKQLKFFMLPPPMTYTIPCLYSLSQTISADMLSLLQTPKIKRKRSKPDIRPGPDDTLTDTPQSILKVGSRAGHLPWRWDWCVRERVRENGRIRSQMLMYFFMVIMVTWWY